MTRPLNTFARGAALFLLLLAGCNRPPPPAVESDLPKNDAGILARVGETEIRVEDFNAYLLRRQTAPTESKAHLLQEMIDTQVLLNRARERGLDRHPEYLRGSQNLLIGLLRQQVLEPELASISVREAEMEQRYQRDLSTRYTQPAQRRGAVVFVEAVRLASPARREEARKRIEEAHRLASDIREDGNEFGALVVHYSDDQATRYKGGDMGWLKEGHTGMRWPTAVVEALLSLEEAHLDSDIIETDGGFYFVRLLEQRPSSVKPLEAVRDGIRHELLREHRRRQEQTFVERMRDGQVIEIVNEELQRLPVPEPVPAPAPPGLP